MRSGGEVVGVLGGMGPEATVDLMRRVIAATPAQDDADHIRMLVDNNPQVPSRISALIDETGPSPAPALIEMARGLCAQGADFLVMPCNTAHHYHSEIAAAVDVPFLNLMELVAEYVTRCHPALQRVGLLASSALSRIQTYEPWFERAGVEVLYPAAERQVALMAAIRAVKAGGVADQDLSAFTSAAADLANGGAQVLLIACTELSVIADSLQASLPVYDAAEVLAQAIVTRARPD
jgi:aspartate racemase